MKEKLRLGEILIEQGVLTSSDLDRALSKQKAEGGLLGEVLLKMGIVKEEEIVVALARQFNYPYLPVQHCDVHSKVIQLISGELARKYIFVPIDRIKNVLTIIMTDPTNEVAKNEITKITGLQLQVLVGTVTEVTNAIKKYYKMNDNVLGSALPEDTISEISFKSAKKNKNTHES